MHWRRFLSFSLLEAIKTKKCRNPFDNTYKSRKDAEININFRNVTEKYGSKKDVGADSHLGLRRFRRVPEIYAASGANPPRPKR